MTLAASFPHATRRGRQAPDVRNLFQKGANPSVVKTGCFEQTGCGFGVFTRPAPKTAFSGGVLNHAFPSLPSVLHFDLPERGLHQ